MGDGGSGETVSFGDVRKPFVFDVWECVRYQTQVTPSMTARTAALQHGQL